MQDKFKSSEECSLQEYLRRLDRIGAYYVLTLGLTLADN
jgi:hypothetical protein